MAADTSLSKAAAVAFDDYSETKQSHDEFSANLKTYYRAFRGEMETRSKAAKWTHKLNPRYVNHIAETTLASLLDERLRFKVRPRARMYDPGEFEDQKAGADALQILLDFQLGADRFSEKQRWFVLQNVIAGVTGMKVYWRHTTKKKKRHGEEVRQITDPYTGEVTGEITVPTVTETVDSVYDGPCAEVCNVADLIWDQAATSVENCRIITHRVWKTYEECLHMQKLGLWKNVSKLKGTEDKSQDRPDWSFPAGQSAPANSKRIEILEIWRREENGIKVYTIGNGTVLLKEGDSPYWHGEMPFVIASTQPDLFRIGGMSQVERIMALQEALWTILNQRLDNLSLVNTGIVMFNENMVDNPSALKFGPLERWAINGPLDQAVRMWSPDPIPAQISLPAESNIKMDMQNISGGFPFTSTSEARTVGAGTATEASLVSTLAQRSVTSTKVALNQAYERIGQQMIELNQQYLGDSLSDILVTVLGADNQYEQKVVVPRMLRGDYEFDTTPMAESLMRQERRAEQTSLFQAALQAAPVFAAIAAQKMGRMINLDALWEDLLETYDKPNAERYFSAMTPALQAQGQSGQEALGQPTQGTTSPLATDAATSPSNAMSMSGETAMQRYMAGQGGSNNLG